MKITVPSGAFAKALSSFQSVISKRTTNPLLSTVLLEAHGSVYTLTGTDLNLTLYTKGSAIIHEEGKVCLPVHILADVVRKMPSKLDITLTFESPSTLLVQREDLVYTLATLDAEKFPHIQSQSIDQFGQFDVETLKKGFECTRISMGGVYDVSLDGLYFHHHEGQLRIVSTDTYCLAVTCLDWSGPSFEPVFLGRRAILEMVKMLDPSLKHTVSLGFSRHHVLLSTLQSSLWSNTMQHQFPDYFKVLPTQYSPIISMPREAFSKKLESLNVLNRDRKSLVRLAFEPNRLFMSIHAGLVGSAQEKIPVSYDGEAFSIKFSLSRLIEILHHLDGDQVNLCFTTKQGPVLFKGDNPQSFYLFMPSGR